MGHSCFHSLAGKVDQPAQALLLQFQQPDLLFQRRGLVKLRVIHDPLDLLQGKRQFPEQQNALQSCQRRIVIQPVARLRYRRGPQQPDGVIVVQRAHADPGDLTDFVYRFHGVSLPYDSTIHYDVT